MTSLGVVWLGPAGKALTGHNGRNDDVRCMVDAMADEEADWALRVLRSGGFRPPAAVAQKGLPGFVGSFASGDGTFSQRTDELLVDGFGS